jgi:uncharacterized protein
MLHPRAFGLIASLTLLATSSLALADETRIVTAAGEGRVEVLPDIAWLNFGVTARAESVAAARDEVAAGVARLLALARDAGLKDEHIATAAVSVSPDYDWNPEDRQRRLRGHLVSRHVTLRLAEIAKLGELTEAALGLGVTDASPAIYDTSRRAELEAEALAAAARDARARAEVMAGALGAGIGAPVRIEAGGGAEIPRPMMRTAMAEADMSGAETYQPGLIRITAQVTASFMLLQP